MSTTCRRKRDQLVDRDPIVGGQPNVFTMAADVTANRPGPRGVGSVGLVDRYVIDGSWLGDVSPPKRPLLLFDGGCPFCRAAARLIARLDREQRLAMLDRDDDAAAAYVARIPEQDVQESWQLIEPSGVRLMHGPAALRLLEYLPATRRLGWALRKLGLTSLVSAANRFLGRIRKPLGRFFPDQRRPRRWP
jgi:predicted DCC family thiol-disulfide oxidoreductase YuxK